ncbi:MAG TPA: discoidin domain-containing protein, partial [Kofleriaceae bacterium]
SAALTDKYMPKEAFGDPGHMAWLALKTPRLHESQALYANIEVSSTWNDDGFGTGALIDGRRETAFSSHLGKPDDHEEWIILNLPSGREFSSIVLHPAANGFPIDFSVELWDGAGWVPRIQQTNYPEPKDAVTFKFPNMEATDRVRFRATKLRHVGADYVLRLAEIELFR